MKIPILDLGVYAKFLLPAAVVAGVLAYMFVREIVIFFWRATHKNKTVKKIKELRQKPQKKVPTEVMRKTDNFAQLTSEQKKAYMRAKELIELQQYVEAAKLFEAINFQRKAIDLLEGKGLIDEACGILLRMGVPYRAAVIYERNGQLQKASELFLRDNKQEHAARCFERMAAEDFNYFRRAGECFLQAGLIDSCLASYGRLDSNAEVMRIALEHNRLEFLQRYFDLPFHAQVLLPQLQIQQLQTLVESLAATPQGALSLAHWTMYRPDEIMVTAAIQKLGINRPLIQVYWSRLDDGFAEFICGLLSGLSQKPPTDMLQIHAEILFTANRLAFADRMREIVGLSTGHRPTTLAIGL